MTLSDRFHELHKQSETDPNVVKSIVELIENSHESGERDGLGCDQSYEKAYEFFQEAYSYGNEKGAEAIAKICEEYMDEHPEMSDKEKREYRKDIKYWKNLADNPPKAMR